MRRGLSWCHKWQWQGFEAVGRARMRNTHEGGMQVQWRVGRGGEFAQLTFCVVELGEGVITKLPVFEEHAELTSAQMGPDIFGVDYQHVSEEQK